MPSFPYPGTPGVLSVCPGMLTCSIMSTSLADGTAGNVPTGAPSMYTLIGLASPVHSQATTNQSSDSAYCSVLASVRLLMPGGGGGTEPYSVRGTAVPVGVMVTPSFKYQLL